MIVFCAVGFVLGWSLDVWWLWTLALLIGAEELLESSVVIAALRDGSRRDLTRVGWRPRPARFWMSSTYLGMQDSLAADPASESRPVR